MTSLNLPNKAGDELCSFIVTYIQIIAVRIQIHAYKVQMSNWKTTADLFEALIERPKMTEKLLAKPPFKYLFDIITETTKKTGFANGLYEGEQLKPDYYGEKNRKIAYLQKIITLAEMMSGQKVSANPQKIVAGMEPEQTNELLQLVHRCATSGKSSDNYVKKVLGGETAEEPEAKQQKKKIERPPSAPKNKKPEPTTNKQPEPPAKQPEPPAKQAPVKQAPGASKKVIQKPAPKVEEPKEQEQPQNIIQKPKKGQEYSKKVRQLMEEGEQQNKKQKEVQVEDTKNQNNIAMGRLGGKKKKTAGEGVEKIISATGQINQKQLDLVKSMIQSICQNTAPLGKSIEFINQDIEAMNKELQFWRKQYNASKTKMQNQLKITEEALLPIYDKLGEIEDQIKDQKGKIQTAKAQIIKNDSTIRDLLMSVVTTK